jgi:phosphohistidine phosphatase
VKQLHLLRHAKSSWDDTGIPDHERPLAPRGRKAARKIAAYMRDMEIRPALVLCSPSTRTRETLDLLDAQTEVQIDPALYAADEGKLLGVLRAVPPDVPSLLLLGHNPGLQRLAVELAGRGNGDLIARLTEKMPTAALASLALPAEDWAKLGPGVGELVAYVVPREL